MAKKDKETPKMGDPDFWKNPSIVRGIVPYGYVRDGKGGLKEAHVVRAHSFVRSEWY